MRIFLGSFLLILYLNGNLLAQIDHYPLGGRALGMANASLNLGDSWSLFNNSAGIAEVTSPEVFFAYDNRFGFSAFQTFGLGTVVPVPWGGGAGLSISRFGDNLYNETRIGLAYAYKLDLVSLGLKVNYLQVSIQDLGSKGTVVLEFGGIAEIIPQLRFAGHIYNLNQAKLNTVSGEAEEIPTILKAGLLYQPVEAFLISAETEKDVDLPASFKLGLEYRIVKNLFLRTGIETEPFISHFGIGFQPRNFGFDYALSSGGDLGISHHISARYRFAKTKE